LTVRKGRPQQHKEQEAAFLSLHRTLLDIIWIGSGSGTIEVFGLSPRPEVSAPQRKPENIHLHGSRLVTKIK
jgi:hypothetical protein